MVTMHTWIKYPVFALMMRYYVPFQMPTWLKLIHANVTDKLFRFSTLMYILFVFLHITFWWKRFNTYVTNELFTLMDRFFVIFHFTICIKKFLANITTELFALMNLYVFLKTRALWKLALTIFTCIDYPFMNWPFMLNQIALCCRYKVTMRTIFFWQLGQYSTPPEF